MFCSCLLSMQRDCACAADVCTDPHHLAALKCSQCAKLLQGEGLLWGKSAKKINWKLKPNEKDIPLKASKN